MPQHLVLYLLNLVLLGQDLCWVNIHLLDGVSIYKVEAAAPVHKDSGQMEAVNDGVEDQSRCAAMTDTGRMVTSIKCDWYLRPWVIFGLSELHGIHFAEHMLPLLFGDVGSVDHVYVLHLEEGIASGRHCSARAGLYPRYHYSEVELLPCLSADDLSGLLDYPAILVGVSGRLVGVSVDGAGLIQNLVQL